MKNLQTQSIPINTTTMYNLDIKRTLPRDVIKWMQGLDLSYSLKDYRKDLTNGFIIAQIISRYQPGKIPMHAFENSQNQIKRDTNWNLLHVFFSKYQLKNVKIQLNQYNKIKLAQDSKSQQLYQFICKLYCICTKRHLSESNKHTQIQISPSKNPNLTASYLLKDDGLQKLDNSSNNDLNQSQEKSDKIDIQKIGNLTNSHKVDGKKQQGSKKGTTKRKSWQQKPDTFYQQQNAYVQKFVFDYLNQILQECFREHQGLQTRIKEAYEKNQLKLTQVIMKNLPLESGLLLKFFTSVKTEINQILPVMLKDISQIWKFFNYFIKMLGYFLYESQQFMILMELLILYGINVNQNQNKKMNKVFMESIIFALIEEVKNCTQWKKKQKIMEITYDFSGRELDTKKAVLFNLKEKLGSTNPLFFSWLAVLVREQTSTKGNLKLIQDYIYYAHQNYSSSNCQLRVPSFKILSEVARNGWVANIQKFFIEEINMKKSQAVNDVEIVYLISVVYFAVLKFVIQGNQYQMLIKGKNQGNTANVKVYNPDHQRLSIQIKNKVQNISMTLAHLYHNTDSPIVKQIIAKESINFIGENATVMLILIYHLSFGTSIDQFCKQQKVQYELKSTKIVISPIKIQTLKSNVNNIISQIVNQHNDKKSPNMPQNINSSIPVHDQLQLINYCLSYIDIKNINIQLWQGISDKICRIIIRYLQHQKYYKQSWEIIQKIYLIIFNYQMKMPNLNTWLCEFIEKIAKESKEQNEVVKKIKSFFNEQYANNNVEEIKICIDQINQMLEEKKISKFIVVEEKKNY